MKKFYIVIGCDCDPDRKGFSQKINDKNLFWDGIKYGIPDFLIARQRFADSTGYWPKITWFVRSDSQINSIFGNEGYCLNKFRNIWETLLDYGDEIAWHPHLYSWDKKNLKWIQKINDTSFTKNCLDKGFKAFKSNWGVPPKTVHGGWGYQDNTTINFYSNSGIISDCSAMPGHNSLKLGNFDNSDWEETQKYPYWISKSNYKLAALEKADSTGVLEIPTSMGKSFLANSLKIFKDQIKRGFYIPNKLIFKYQVPLMTLNPILNKDLINNSINTTILNNNNYFLSYFHADEFLPSTSKSKIVKLTYSLEGFMKNINYLTHLIKQKNYQPSFETLASYSDIVRESLD